MTLKSIVVVLLFLLSFGLMEVHKLVPPSNEPINLFFGQTETVQSLRWYVKDTCNMVITIIILLGVTISLKKSFLKDIVNVLLCFHVFDLVMYWYDYKTSNTIFIIAYSIVFLSVIYLINKWKVF